MIQVYPHPLLVLGAFTTTFPVPLGDYGGGQAPALLGDLLRPDASAPVGSDDTVRAAVRDLLRHGGFKPTGRSKPASEYLRRAAFEGTLAPINVAVDAGNAVSLHSGIPVSVVDLDRVAPPLSIAIASPGTSFVFNASGQAIDVSGLLCLGDAAGPCANAVKDAMRTKTDPSTRRTLSILWGSRALGDRVARALAWYMELLRTTGAATEVVIAPAA